MEFARNACSLGQTRVLSGQLLQAMSTFNQLVCHRVKVILQLPNFILASDPYTLMMVAPRKGCGRRREMAYATNQPTRGKQAKQAANRGRHHKNEKDQPEHGKPGRRHVG